MTEPDEIAGVPFGERRIGTGEPVLVIAEIGINHEGDPEICARMIDEAASSSPGACFRSSCRSRTRPCPNAR